MSRQPMKLGPAPVVHPESTILIQSITMKATLIPVVLSEYEVIALRRWTHAFRTVQTRVCTLNGFLAQHPDLLSYDTEALEDIVDSRRLTPTARADYAGHLKSFFKFAIAKGYADRNPAEGMHRPRKPRPNPNPVPEDELNRLLWLCMDNHKMRLWLMLGAYEGMRVSEIARLQVDWIDLGANLVTVHGKGGHTRKVPLHPKVVQAFYDYGLPPSGHVFLTRNAKHPYRANDITNLISGFMRKCGTQRTGHKLRHRFGTRVYEVTGDIAVASELLGHANLDMSRRYVQVVNDRKRNAVNLI